MRLSISIIAVLIGTVLTSTLWAQMIPDYPTQIQPLLDATCTACHSWLASHEKVMAQVSAKEPTKGVRAVVPGDAAASLLIWKLEGKTPDGTEISRMPKDADPLEADQIQLIKDWIDAGALAEAPIRSVTVKDVSLAWQVAGESLNVKVSAPTKGWVSVGFDPTSGMKDANFIIGYVKEGTVHIRDDYGTSRTGHAEDTSAEGKDNITNKSGTEAKGNTEIGFTIPLDSGDPKDRVLVPGKSYKVILAYGRRDDFKSYHKKKVSTKITL